jgi:hypothetical protein
MSNPTDLYIKKIKKKIKNLYSPLNQTENSTDFPREKATKNPVDNIVFK